MAHHHGARHLHDTEFRGAIARLCDDMGQQFRAGLTKPRIAIAKYKSLSVTEMMAGALYNFAERARRKAKSGTDAQLLAIAAGAAKKGEGDEA